MEVLLASVILTDFLDYWSTKSLKLHVTLLGKWLSAELLISGIHIIIFQNSERFIKS